MKMNGGYLNVRELFMYLKNKNGKLSIVSQISLIQHIKRVDNGQTTYLFGDDDILKELEYHHITKNENTNSDHLDTHFHSSILRFTECKIRFWQFYNEF